jgi:hypothetical protein
VVSVSSVYGCHSKPRQHGYWAKHQMHNDGKAPIDCYVLVPDTMSRECRYDRQREDAKCEGCSRINGVSPAPTFKGE